MTPPYKKFKGGRPKLNDKEKSFLIEEVQQRPVLWDKNEGEYGNKNTTVRSWIEISSRMQEQLGIDLDVDDLKYVWQNLRTSFRHIRSALARASAGDEGESNERTTRWPFLEAMSFLLDNGVDNHENSIDVEDSSISNNFLHINNGEQLIMAAFENAEVDADDDPTLNAAKIAYFEAQTQLAISQTNELKARESEARAREQTEKIKAELAAAQIETERIRAQTIENESRAREAETRAREKTEIAKEAETRANERLATIRAKLLELEYQEKIRNAGSSVAPNNNREPV